MPGIAETALAGKKSMTKSADTIAAKTITVITTIRNGHGHWPGFFANLKALLGQNDAAILVDDGSFPAVCLPPVLQDDTRVTLLSPGRIGRGAALNFAISHARTDLIAIQDVDDRSDPARLRIMKQLAAHYRDHLIFCQATRQDEADGVMPASSLPENAPPRPIPAARLYRGNPFHHSGLAFPKTLWQMAGGYDTTLPCCLDLDFYLRCLAQSGQPLQLLSCPLVTRHTGVDRHYARLPARIYHETVLNIRAKYRPRIEPPFWTYLYDLRHFALAIYARIKWRQNSDA